MPYTTKWYEWIIDHVISSDPLMREDGTRGRSLTNDQIETIRGFNWTRRNTDIIVREMLRLEVPRDVHNGSNEWGSGNNEGLQRKDRVMKWLGMQYGLQMDPVEPRVAEESNGRDGLGVEVNLDDLHGGSSEDEGVGGNVGVVEGGDDAGHSDEWFIGLGEQIDNSGRDYLGGVLDNEVFEDLEKHWWQSIQDMKELARHLNVPEDRTDGGTRESIANLLVEHYGYEG